MKNTRRLLSRQLLSAESATRGASGKVLLPDLPFTRAISAFLSKNKWRLQLWGDYVFGINQSSITLSINHCFHARTQEQQRQQKQQKRVLTGWIISALLYLYLSAIDLTLLKLFEHQQFRLTFTTPLAQNNPKGSGRVTVSRDLRH